MSKMASSVNESQKLRIVLLGKTGVGKSATGNTILGGQEFHSKISGYSVTKNCQWKSNSAVRVIDTPGFFDMRTSKEDFTKEIVMCIAMSAPGPHAFILIVKVDRFTEEENTNVNLIMHTFGREIMRYMIVLFTGKDYLEDDGLSIDDYLENAPDVLKNLLSYCGDRYIAFNNKIGDEERRQQQSCALMYIVRDMVNRNGGKCYTNEMYIAAEEGIRAEEEKRTHELAVKKNKERKAIIKNYLDSMIKLKEDSNVTEQKNTVREQVLGDADGGRVNVFWRISKRLDAYCSIM